MWGCHGDQHPEMAALGAGQWLRYAVGESWVGQNAWQRGDKALAEC